MLDDKSVCMKIDYLKRNGVSSLSDSKKKYIYILEFDIAFSRLTYTFSYGFYNEDDRSQKYFTTIFRTSASPHLNLRNVTPTTFNSENVSRVTMQNAQF